MIGVDTNILLQGVYQVHPAHERTVRFIETHITPDNPACIPIFVITEFIHAVPDPRRFTHPISFNAGLKWINELITQPSVRVLLPDSKTIGIANKWLDEFGLERKRVTDTYIAATLLSNGVTTLLTSDLHHFASFKELTVISP